MRAATWSLDADLKQTGAAREQRDPRQVDCSEVMNEAPHRRTGLVNESLMVGEKSPERPRVVRDNGFRDLQSQERKLANMGGFIAVRKTGSGHIDRRGLPARECTTHGSLMGGAFRTRCCAVPSGYDARENDLRRRKVI
ncbi:MAG TPA: hypothetical protein VIP11_00120 [Gemmatimonadaceae bacterium]